MSVSYKFADFWQQDEFSDVTVVVAAPDGTELSQLPGHGIILSQSPYFRAQLSRWQSNAISKNVPDSKPSAVSDKSDRMAAEGQDTELLEPAAHSSPAVTDADDAQINNACGNSSGSKPRLVLTLQDAAQEPAAVAVLRALYSVKPIPELLSGLPQEQQLHAALLADMWQVADVSTAAVKILADAAAADQCVSKEACEQLLQLAAPPTCLLPLFEVLVHLLAKQTDQQSTATLKCMLLSVLGDLEEVWADQALQDTLLRLPLGAMVVLLGCNELMVASEDTVLYTADTYVRKITDLQQRQTAEQLLAPLVRAQHLSEFWLTAAALSTCTTTLLHGRDGSFVPQLRQLLKLKAAVGALSLQSPELQKLVPDAPDSWSLEQRSIRTVPDVEVTWKLDVSTLVSTAQMSASQQKMINLDSPSTTSPIGGVVFGILIQLDGKADAQGSKIGVFAKPKNGPADTYLWFGIELSVAGTAIDKRASTPVAFASQCWGWSDFFELGAMAGGWDAAAWAKAGLPTTGELVLKLRVTEVAHASSS